MGAERRQFEREFSPRSSVTLQVEGQSYALQVLDESEGGLGCFAGNQLPLASNQIVDVEMTGSETRQAVVRYLAPHSRGGFHVGLQWQEVDAPLIVAASRAN